MLRNRCPYTVDLALKWCKAKTKWVDHVYINFVNILLSQKYIRNGVVYVKPQKEVRKEVVRNILGISKTNRVFNFDSTIHWDNLTNDEINYWKNISKWVKWFQFYYQYITNDIDIGFTDEEIYQRCPVLKIYEKYHLYKYIKDAHKKSKI